MQVKKRNLNAPRDKRTPRLITQKTHALPMSKKLYLSADSIKIDSLFELAKTFANEGGELLIIDEIHKYIGFEHELKKIYDFLELQVIFSGSSALQIDNSKADLIR